MANKEIIVFASKIMVGGHTSFLMELLKYLISNPDMNVTLMYEKIGDDILIPPGIQKIQYSTLNKRQCIVQLIKSGYWFDIIALIKKQDKNKKAPFRSIQRLNFVSARFAMKVEKKYDIAISVSELFCNYYVANNIDAKRKIGWLHTDYAELEIDHKIINQTLEKLDYIGVVSQNSLENMKNQFSLYKNKFVYIKNMIDAEQVKEMAKEKIEDVDYEFDGLRIVTVCRIDNTSKRLDRAIQICKNLVNSGIEFRWYVVGNGPDFQMIYELVKENKLENNFILLGNRNNPYPYINYADVFVLTSQYEGKPIVIDEALILETPVVVTKYNSAEEQVEEQFGYIVENDNAKTITDITELLVTNNWIQDKKKALVNYKWSNKESKQSIEQLVDI